MLAAEALVLLSLIPDGRTAHSGATDEVMSLGAAGALVAELVLLERLGLDGRGRVEVRGGHAGHPLLDAALDAVGPGPPSRLRSRLPGIARRAGRRQVIDHLVARELVGRVKPRFLRPTRHPPQRGPHEQVLWRYRSAVASDTPLLPLDAIVVGLSGPCRLLEVVAPERATHGHARWRIGQAIELVPVLRTVREAIEAQIAAAAAPVVT